MYLAYIDPILPRTRSWLDRASLGVVDLGVVGKGMVSDWMVGRGGHLALPA